MFLSVCFLIKVSGISKVCVLFIWFLLFMNEILSTLFFLFIVDDYRKDTSFFVFILLLACLLNFLISKSQ